jgi:hypothetical protein
MDSRPVPQRNWLLAYLVVAGILIVLISIGNFMLFSHAWTTETIGLPAEDALILTGVFLALPLGLVNIWLGWSILRQDRRGAGKAAAGLGLLAGLLGLVTGLIWYGALIFLLLGGFRGG